MNPKIKTLALAHLLFALCLPALAQGTAFTYQGRMNDGASPANGAYDLRFAIYNALTIGTQQGNSLTNSATAVSNGLFTVSLDFGNQFPGTGRWLEIAVRTNGAASFFTLTPRQLLTPAPYAITAGNVISNGLASGTYGNAVTFNNANNGFIGAFSGNGASVTNVNAASLGGLASSNFWQTAGNSGASSNNFLGTTDDEAFEVRVANMRVLRLENIRHFLDFEIDFGAPNVIAGSPANYVVNSFGATISGGGATNYDGYNSTNIVTGDFGTVGGGGNNTAGSQSTVSGGFGNFAWDGGNAIVGGFNNYANGSGLAAIGGGYHNAAGINDVGVYMVIGGGIQNTNVSTAGTIGGGYLNYVSNYCSTVPGGFSNSASADFSFAAGHRANAKHVGSFVWADSTAAPYVSTGTNQFLIRAGGGVGINTANPSRVLEVHDIGDTEIGLRSSDTGSHLWTLQSSGTNGSVNLDASFQIIDRTLNLSRFYIGTNGFVGIGTTSPTNKLHVAGGVSATVFVTTSDRNAKENFEPVSSSEVLDKVAALPITRWTFREMPGQKHLGPMAQDFHAAFGLGAGDTGIATVDESGVALAAIQGLNHKLEEQRAENAELKRRLDALEKIIHNQKSN